ncbi:MAG: response regulator [Lachnospiraceae bacterium]|nr:response regulator [Lachnospiraceae bacterium]
MALLFATIIIIYNSLLTDYARKSIYENGQLNAGRTAEEVALYLSSATDALNISTYTIDKMLHDGEPEEAFREYLIDETKIINSSIVPNSTGLYAYIDGNFYDGLEWEPGDDFIPTERPWYKEAINHNGEIALVDPYLDLYTGEVVMTLAKSTPHNEGVVALDVTLERIQEIIESNLRDNSSTITMVVTSSGFVVGHSDPSQLGIDYSEYTDSVGSYAYRLISVNDGNFFHMTYKKHNYTVFAVEIAAGWYGISIADNDVIFKPLTIIMLLSISSILLIFIVFAVIMFRSGKKDVLNSRLQSLLLSSADIYMSLCDLDVINNSVVEIKNVNPAISNAVASVDHNMKEVFLNIMKGLPESPTKQMAIDFTDLSTIDDRMYGTNNATLEYLSYGNIWVRARLIVSERTKDGRISHVLWMLENITKEKIERERLINKSEQAVAANEAKSAFLSNMSHEIRTPINAVLGMNEMILRETDDPNIITYSQNIKSAGNSLLILINDILDFSKIESGKMEIIPTDYQISSLLNDLINMIKARMDAKGLELILDIDPTIPSVLYGDEIRIKQIITNILTNAAKYTEKGSVSISVKHTKSEEHPDSISLRVSVKDTGIGIKKENLDKLFVKFERIDEKRNRNIEGTGLGMSITSNLLEMMGSKLNVESEYGVGSVFWFDLIQTVSDWEPIGDYKDQFNKFTDKETNYLPKFKAQNARILVVDDTPINLTVFKGLLKKTGIDIDTADNGMACIELALKNKYDIIFLDHMMPHMDGVETLKKFKENTDNINNDTPIICLTANAISGAREFYLDSGFTDYLSKPVNFERLEDMILKYLSEDKLIGDQ